MFTRGRNVYFALRQARPSMTKRKPAALESKLTDAEKDLLSRLEHGYQLETDSLGRNPVLRNLKDNEIIRPASSNASTVKALQQSGLIAPGRSRDPLTIVWRLAKKVRL